MIVDLLCHSSLLELSFTDHISAWLLFDFFGYSQMLAVQKFDDFAFGFSLIIFPHRHELGYILSMDIYLLTLKFFIIVDFALDVISIIWHVSLTMSHPYLEVPDLSLIFQSHRRYF